MAIHEHTLTTKTGEWKAGYWPKPEEVTSSNGEIEFRLSDLRAMMAELNEQNIDDSVRLMYTVGQVGQKGTFKLVSEQSWTNGKLDNEDSFDKPKTLYKVLPEAEPKTGSVENAATKKISDEAAQEATAVALDLLGKKTLLKNEGLSATESLVKYYTRAMHSAVSAGDIEKAREFMNASNEWREEDRRLRQRY
jgi:hypothetical protein